MQKNKLSINDLANKLKVSKTTVSFILNGKARERRISEALIERVKMEASKLGYEPNQFAKSLRTGRTNIIGLMVEDISNPFYASIARIIEDKVYRNGYKIIYCSSENNRPRGTEFLKMFTTLGVDGCIIVPTKGMEPEITEMVKNGKSVVLLDRKFENELSDVVMVDNASGMYSGVKHLIDQGYKNIAMVGLALDKIEKEDRIVGYKKAMADHNLEPRLFPLKFKIEHHEYVNDIRTFLSENRTLDAVVFGTNYLAIAGLEAIYQLDLRIPQDIAVLSFDDHDLFRIHRPGITAVAQPIEQIAQTTIDTLLSMLHGKSEGGNNGKVINLPTSIIVRESSSPARKRRH